MKEYVMGGRIEKGKLKIRNLPDFEKALRSFHDGAEVFITIEKAHATRSASQNAYYHAVILKLLAEHTEHNVFELHEYCKKRFNPKAIIICDPNGVIVGDDVIGQTTTRLNKITFGEYVEAIRQWMRDDLGIDTPDPDPNWRQTEAA